MQEQEYEQRIQDVENKAIGALNEERKRGDELEVRLNQAHASHDKRVEDFKAEANTKHDQKIAEERKRITSEFEASYAQTVEHATNAIAATKKQYEDQAAIEQAKFIQLKTEFDNYKREMAEKINEAAAQNLSLQDQIDDLQEQLKHVAKAQHASVPNASVQKAEPATLVCPTSTLLLLEHPMHRPPEVAVSRFQSWRRLQCWHKRRKPSWMSCSKMALPSRNRLSATTSPLCRRIQGLWLPLKLSKLPQMIPQRA